MKTIKITQTQLIQSVLVFISGYFVIFSLKMTYGLLTDLIFHGLRMFKFDMFTIGKYLVLFDGFVTFLLLTTIIILFFKKVKTSNLDSNVISITFPIKYFWTIGIIALVSFILKTICGLTSSFSIEDAMKVLPESEIIELTDGAKELEVWAILFNQIKMILLYVLYFGLMIKNKKVTKANIV